MYVKKMLFFNKIIKVDLWQMLNGDKKAWYWNVPSETKMYEYCHTGL